MVGVGREFGHEAVDLRAAIGGGLLGAFIAESGQGWKTAGVVV